MFKWVWQQRPCQVNNYSVPDQRLQQASCWDCQGKADVPQSSWMSSEEFLSSSTVHRAGAFLSSVSHDHIDQISVNAAFVQTSDAGEGRSPPTPELLQTLHKPNDNRSNLQTWHASEASKREEDHGNLTKAIFERGGKLFSYPLGQFDSETQVCLPNAPWSFSRRVAATLGWWHDSWRSAEEHGAERAWPGVWAGPPGPAGGAGSISQRCSAWPLASFHASLLFQCKSEATQVLHLRYWVNMERKPALVSCGHERNEQTTKHQVIRLPHQRGPHRLPVGWNTQTTSIWWLTTVVTFKLRLLCCFIYTFIATILVVYRKTAGHLVSVHHCS